MESVNFYSIEKWRAHYDLEAVKAAIADRGLDSFTATARRGVSEVGLTGAEGIAVLLGLERSMLYKSMTTRADHRVWQDVYHAR